MTPYASTHARIGSVRPSGGVAADGYVGRHASHTHVRRRDVRVEDVPDATLVDPTDALVRITRSCICGSDLWPYKSYESEAGAMRMGHEFIGVVEDVGADVATLKRGDVVVAPFVASDGTCTFCAEGLQTSCRNVAFWGADGNDGGQGEAARAFKTR